MSYLDLIGVRHKMKTSAFSFLGPGPGVGPELSTSQHFGSIAGTDPPSEDILLDKRTQLMPLSLAEIIGSSINDPGHFHVSPAPSALNSLERASEWTPVPFRFHFCFCCYI